MQSESHAKRHGNDTSRCAIIEINLIANDALAFNYVIYYSNASISRILRITLHNYFHFFLLLNPGKIYLNTLFFIDHSRHT